MFQPEDCKNASALTAVFHASSDWVKLQKYDVRTSGAKLLNYQIDIVGFHPSQQKAHVLFSSLKESTSLEYSISTKRFFFTRGKLSFTYRKKAICAAVHVIGVGASVWKAEHLLRLWQRAEREHIPPFLTTNALSLKIEAVHGGKCRKTLKYQLLTI